jgi:hypothetical protein
VSEHPEVLCYRCGQPGEVEWLDVRTLGDAEPRYWQGRAECVTPGCVDPDGSRRLDQPTPEEMRKRADRAWNERQRALVEDR